MDLAFGAMYDMMAPMWVELSFIAFFTLGFALLRVDLLPNLTGQRKHNAKAWEDLREYSFKQVIAEVDAGNTCAAIKAWRSIQAKAPTPVDVLKQVAQAFLATEPDALVREIAGHMEGHPSVLRNTRTVTVVLDVIARTGNVKIMEDMLHASLGRLSVTLSYQSYEVLLGGYAAAGKQHKVTALCSQLRADRQKLTARGYSLIIKGFLRHGLLDAALKQTQDMHQQGFYVPPFAVTLLVRTALEAGRGVEILNTIESYVTLPPDATGLLLEDCHKRNDLDLARRIEKLARAGNIELLSSSYDCLLKLYTVAGDFHAMELFKDMQQSGVRISEGLCVGLLARCADVKLLRFAEEIAGFLRGRDGMTLAAYSGLMKVYAYSGLYDKACDLYNHIREQGLEPDAMMYGCLMKFAVECGRTELSRELFERTPTLEIQNYMSLIRAAGRERNAGKALAVLQKMKDMGLPLDVAAYNCALDACVSAGDLQRAQDLMKEMRKIGALDIVTFNTLLKGRCLNSDVSGAKELLLEIERAGLKPNDVSYNCVINLAVSSGNFHEAWETIRVMEGNGVPVDQYTVSIMMKALRKDKSSKEVGRALALLDRVGLDVCSDEVLLNSVLETCIRHREHGRLTTILADYERAGVRPSLHTYGSLIKACSTLKRLNRCWELWQEMVELRGMEPNDIVLGCMLDALVCNGRVGDAVALFNTWKAKVPPNTVMYSTLVKGFANSRQAGAAMGLFDEMREARIKMNTVVYNTLIDSQARAGAMNEVSKLIASMEADAVQADAITYSTIVKGYCVRGNLEKAFEVVRQMQRNKMANDAVIYNTMLDGCTRHNRMDLADVVLQDMNRNQVVPSSFTLGILVKMYGRRRQLDKAFEVIEELPKKYGFNAHPQAKTCLMSACINNGNLPKAFEVFQDLKATSHGVADGKTYGILISGCVRGGWLEQAAALIEEAHGIGGTVQRPCDPPLEAETLDVFVRAVSQRGQMPKVGMPLLEKLRAAGFPLGNQLAAATRQTAPGAGLPFAAGGEPVRAEAPRRRSSGASAVAR